MGVSTDAILCWGVDLGDEFPVDRLTMEEFRMEGDPEAYVSHFCEGVVLEIHCSYSHPMYILAVDGARFYAWRGDPVAVELPVVGEDWQDKLDAALLKLGLETQKGAWLLFSLWGA